VKVILTKNTTLQRIEQLSPIECNYIRNQNNYTYKSFYLSSILALLELIMVFFWNFPGVGIFKSWHFLEFWVYYWENELHKICDSAKLVVYQQNNC
jgi:hypothetical protein